MTLARLDLPGGFETIEPPEVLLKVVLATLVLAVSFSAHAKAKPLKLKGYDDKGAFTSCEPPPPEQMCAAIATPLHVACAEGGGKLVSCKACKVLCTKKVAVKSTKPTM